METAVKPKRKPPKASNEGTKAKDFPAKEAIVALKKKFKGAEGTMVIRYLWTNCDVHRFRVNWWVRSAIVSSKFVHVFTDKSKVVIKEVTDVKQQQFPCPGKA